jgi:hypothetical protein
MDERFMGKRKKFSTTIHDARVAELVACGSSKVMITEDIVVEEEKE